MHANISGTVLVYNFIVHAFLPIHSRFALQTFSRRKPSNVFTANRAIRQQVIASHRCIALSLVIGSVSLTESFAGVVDPETAHAGPETVPADRGTTVFTCVLADDTVALIDIRLAELA